MPAPGARLGVYEILDLVGEGGMGQVYRARDTRLDRVVALKVLPEAVAADAERRERFDREARAVAALNHPHICQLHDVGDAGDTRFLVMEYLEGETLQARLLRGPVPIAELLRHAIALADALDHAHRRGLVHRDVKPANIMLTASGVKLLDFGLSRLQPKTDLPALETMTHDRAPLTAGGAVLGTYPYMSPEQLTGKEADARADIFACGAVLYEMATGERAFAGTTAATVIGAILHTDPPPVSTRQSLVPPALDRIVGRCLAKEPDNRWQTARDLLLELQWLADKPAGETIADRRRPSVRGRVMMSAAIGVAAIALIAAYLMSAPVAAPADPGVIVLPLSPPATMAPDLFATSPVTISPDGRRFVFSATGPSGQQILWVRPIDSSDAQPLPGTEGGAMPFWAPDSSTIGFFALNKLKKVAIAGGTAQTLCDAPQSRGGSWSAENVILFSAGIGHELYYVSGEGGNPAAIPPDGINLERVQPSFLPDGRHFLYFGRSERQGVFVGSLDSAQATMLIPNSPGAVFVQPGYLLSLEGPTTASPEMTLLAQAFDLKTMQARGQRVPLASGVQFHSLLGLAAFSVSNTGVLIYRVRPRRTTNLTWFDRDGRSLDTLGSPNILSQPALSRDGRMLAVRRFDAGTQRPDLWSVRVDRGTEERLTADGTLNAMPIWSPDGNRIAFSSARGSPPNLFVKDLTTGGEQRLVESSFPTHGTDWTTGNDVIYATLNPRSGWDIMRLAMAGPEADRKPKPLVVTPFDEHFGRVSHDGKWLAYMSEESGTREVYVQRFPGPGAKEPISTNGGTEPKWSSDGRTLFYLAPNDVVMAVPVTPGDTLQPGTPAPAVNVPAPPRNARELQFWSTYAVSNDGRLLINTVTHEATSPAATIMFNWPALLIPRNPTAR